ncbi:glycerol-3-phosphate acyltransferase [Planococcus salinus]|uniref:Glycerol-3-phosphate acyltransferase n=1 Tax=Planococcus salinus TaxID=1848460 RepID=A0A3M8P8R1_9BACL|nr:glycerol-3-phosphate acyltransferase [Planococcus salinus]RNF40096.1 glycerol-3-phosphate acyltransferase [Planococcus salinus]
MIIYWIAAYFIGNVLTAWWVGKWYGIDLRQQRSGNLGARNAGAVIGRAAFVLTFLGDAGKSVLVLWIGFYFNFELWTIAVGGLFVITGHLFPLWLKGRGGKGIASFIGVSLFLTPGLFLIMFIAFALAFPFIKSATLTMLVSYFAFVAAAVFSHSLGYTWPLLAALALIIFKHQQDIKESYKVRFSKM